MSTLTRAAHTGTNWLAEHLLPTHSTPLAQPPEGSGLKPVMGDQGLPYVGWAPVAINDFAGFARKRYDTYGPVSWTGMLGTRAVNVLGPDALGEVLNNRDKAFANGRGWSYFIGPFFNRGIMLLDFEEHLEHKRIMQQAFTRDRLIDYLGTMNSGIARVTGEWRPGRHFPMYESTKHLLLDVATEVFVGEEPGPESDDINEAFIDTVAAGMAYVRADVPGGRWHRGIVGRKQLEEYFRALIPAKRAGNGTDLFSWLCRAQTDDGLSFSDDDVVNHMIFVLMAAHDTSAITTGTVAYYLGKHPEWQHRLRAEVKSMGKPMLDYADLDRMPLMDMVFREALRINPPVGGIARRTVKDTSIVGHYIPANTLILLLPQAQHRLEKFWDQPHRFDPERFAPHRREDKQHRFLWSPFGGGVHKCIGMYFGGMQVKSIMYQLLLNFSWTVPDGYRPEMKYGTGYYPADGLPVHLTRLGA
ncbi:cytochrome P450 [Smaragdicoccus niigatensis]|uniref:cytochrome P450 n=1 Tax=Smaragdicoccus niigatensis TaxID=359359 RepID=UPI0003A91FEF|nr:cytochrome P450 [Smaragdicoccus niigatensis]